MRGKFLGCGYRVSGGLNFLTILKNLFQIWTYFYWILEYFPCQKNKTQKSSEAHVSAISQFKNSSIRVYCGIIAMAQYIMDFYLL
jgi:hypothetical protein